jgi:hypothetical protein
MFNIEWTHQPVTLTESQQAKLDWEIADISDDLEEACDLIFHTVRLTDDWDGPIIIVDAKEGNRDTLFLTYYKNPEWIDINIEDNP